MSPMFTSAAEASQRWITEGKSYKDKINEWLDIIYMDRKQPEEECPEETRRDMAAYVLEQIKAYNQDGNYAELRQLFPPDNDPFDWQSLNITNCMSQVAILSDDRLVVTRGQWHENQQVWVIANNTAVVVENVFMYGKSHDKKYFAKVYVDKIEVTEGWDGPVIKTFYPTLSYGEKYAAKEGLKECDFGSIDLQQVVVFPSGQRIGLAASAGIFVLDDNGCHFIETESSRMEEAIGEKVEKEKEEDDEEGDEEGFIVGLHYPHIDVSPDEKYMVAGSQSSYHLIFEEINGKWTMVASVEPRSSYPNLAKFNYKVPETEVEKSGPQVLLCSCHFSRSASIALPVKNITPGFSASGYNADDTLNYVDDQRWVFAAGTYSWGYALGCNDGYIWFKDYTGWQWGYLHVGGTVMDIDFSDDRKTMVAASFSGQVIVYDCSSVFSNKGIFRNPEARADKRPDDFAITNTAYKDVKRYLFFSGHAPMIW